MLPPDAFVYKLPWILDPSQRVLFEGAAYNFNAARHAYEEIFARASSMGTAVIDERKDKDVALFRAAWSMIDSSFMLSKILMRLQLDGDSRVKAFNVHAAIATEMRNRADHLHMNFANTANLSAPTPLMGTISYFFLSRLSPMEGEMILISTGSMPSKSKLRMVNPAGKDVTFPVGLFSFQAFGELLNLSELNNCIEALAPIFCNELEEKVRVACTELAEAHGVSADKLMEHPGGGLRIAMKVEFNETKNGGSDKL